MTDEIQGLKFFVEGRELADHLAARVKYHKGRSEWYAGRVADLKAGGVTHGGQTGDPLEQLEKKRDEHDRKAARFMFMREHVGLNARYVLSDSDLENVEFVGGRYA